MIAYSHINEDNRIELAILKRYELDACVTVTGSAERVISILYPKITNCVAIDVNEEAQMLLKLKVEALKTLNVKEYLAFVGHYNCDKSNRTNNFHSILPGLDKNAREYWTKHRKTIDNGILNAGHYEQFISRVKPINRIFLGGGFSESLTKPLSECKNFPNLRWKLLVWLFGFRIVYMLMGNRDIAFISSDGNTKLIPKAFDETLNADIAHRSYQYHLVFNGHLRDMAVADAPPSVSISDLEQFKATLKKDNFQIDYVTSDYAKAINEGQLYFDDCLYSTSDILSFVDFNYILNLLADIKSAGKTNVHIVLRVFLRNRINSEQLNKIDDMASEVNDISKEELSGHYQILHIKL